MSGFSWQDAAVAALAAGALAWLLVRRVRSRRRAGAAAACENCPAGTPVPGVRPAPEPTLLVSIGEAPPREK